jgi:hypothetical protein
VVNRICNPWGDSSPLPLRVKRVLEEHQTRIAQAALNLLNHTDASVVIREVTIETGGKIFLVFFLCVGGLTAVILGSEEIH